MTTPTDAQAIAALQAFVTTRLGAVDFAIRQIPYVVASEYQAALAPSGAAASAAAVAAGLDSPSAAALAASIVADVASAFEANAPKRR